MASEGGEVGRRRGGGEEAGRRRGGGGEGGGGGEEEGRRRGGGECAVRQRDIPLIQGVLLFHGESFTLLQHR